jgi:hypothetical protein
MQRWMRAGCFERIVEDVQSLLRQFAGRKGQPTAAVIDSRTLQSTPESDHQMQNGLSRLPMVDAGIGITAHPTGVSITL